MKDIDPRAVEAGARALARIEDGDTWPTNEALGGSMTGTRDDEYRDVMHEDAETVLMAAKRYLYAQALREHAANLRFIANRSRQDEATGMYEAADLAIARADELEKP